MTRVRWRDERCLDPRDPRRPRVRHQDFHDQYDAHRRARKLREAGYTVEIIQVAAGSRQAAVRGSGRPRSRISGNLSRE